MSLIKCDECGKEISDKSKMCIGCGARTYKKTSKDNKNIKGYLCALSVIVMIITLIIVIKMFFYSVIVINSSNMIPTLRNGEIVILNKTSKIERYDIIAFEYENNLLVERVYGLPGETIKVEDGSIYVNDKKIEDEYAYGKTVGYAMTTLKDDEYFVLADNRNGYLDSRSIEVKTGTRYITQTLGPVKSKNVKGVLFKH